MEHASRSLPWIALAAVLMSSAPRAWAGDVTVRGLLDVVAAQRGDAFATNLRVRGDSPYDAYGARLFVDGQVNPALTARLQVLLHDASGPYVHGAYLTWTPKPERDLNVQAGKIPWPIGTWAPRTYSDRNPLIGAPLLYQYHSSLAWSDVPADVDALLAAAGQGATGLGYTGSDADRGMPIVDDSYWDVGVTVTGSRRPLEYAVSVMAGAPGWGSTMEDDNSGKTVAGRVGVQPHPALRVGVSGAIGPYLGDWVRHALPPGRVANDYDQRLLMADAEFSLGPLDLRAEGADNVWETSFAGDLGVRSGYIEGRIALASGAFLAGRWDELRFDDVADSSGTVRSWDANVSRVEAGIGYRFTRDVVGKTTWQRTQVAGRPLELFAAQLSVRF